MSEIPAPTSPAAGGGEVENLVGALASPRAAFEAIARRPTWVAALVLLALLGTVGVWAAYSKVDAGEFRTYVESSGRKLPDSVSDEQILKWTRVSSVLGAAIFAPLTYLAVAGIFLFLMRMSGAALDFRRSLAVTVHGFLPFGVAAILGLALSTLRTEVSMREIESGALVPSHLGALVSADGAVGRAILSSLDLFSVWCVLLLGMGFSIVARLPRAKAYLAVGAVWSLGILLKLALAALR